MDFAQMVHGAQEFTWGPLVVAGDEITTEVEVADISERGGMGFFVFESRSDNQDGERVCTGKWTCIVRGETEMEAGESLPDLKVTPGPLPDRPLRGRVGRLQPDPHRRGVRARRSACPAGSCTACGRWRRSRARRPRRPAGPAALQRLSVQFRGMGVPEQEVVVTSKVREVRGRRRDRRRRGAPGRHADRAPRRGRARASPRLRPGAHRPPGAAARQGDRRLRGHRPARRLEGARRRSGGDRRPVDDPQRARGARGAGPARASAHVGGPRADRRRLPLLRRPPAAGAPRHGASSPRARWR